MAEVVFVSSAAGGVMRGGPLLGEACGITRLVATWGGGFQGWDLRKVVPEQVDRLVKVQSER